MTKTLFSQLVLNVGGFCPRKPDSPTGGAVYLPGLTTKKPTVDSGCQRSIDQGSVQLYRIEAEKFRLLQHCKYDISAAVPGKGKFLSVLANFIFAMLSVTSGKQCNVNLDNGSLHNRNAGTIVFQKFRGRLNIY
jgi:hypothetical protein